MMRLSPVDEEREAQRLADKWNIPRSDIRDIKVLDWITGEILVITKSGHRHDVMEPAEEAR